MILGFSGCASSPLLKVGSDGYFRFKNEPIEVMDPFPNRDDFTIYERSNSVDFVAGAVYWMFLGQYAVEVIQRPEAIKSNDNFVKFNLDRGMKIYLRDDRSLAGFRFKLRKAEAITVNGRPAVRAIGVDMDKSKLKNRIPAVLIVTCILFDKRIVFGSLLFPLDRVGPDALEDLSKWRRYNSWVATINDKNVSNVSHAAESFHPSISPPFGEAHVLCCRAK